MKKLYTLIAVLFISITTFAQADLQVFHYNLNNGDTLKIQSPAIGRIIGWGFKNIGPNAILATDTLFLQIKSLTPPNIYKLTLTSVGGIPVGDTVSYVDTFFFNQGPANGTTLNWCDSVWVKRGANSLQDPVLTNNKVCKSLIVKNTTTSIFDVLTNDKKGSVAKLDVYPNPATNRISFKQEFAGNNAIVYVRDITGRLVREEKLGKLYGEREISIDVSNLNAGIFIVELVTDNSRSVGRVMVQK